MSSSEAPAPPLAVVTFVKDEDGWTLPMYGVRAGMLVVATDYRHHPQRLVVRLRRVASDGTRQLLDDLGEPRLEPAWIAWPER